MSSIESHADPVAIHQCLAQAERIRSDERNTAQTDQRLRARVRRLIQNLLNSGWLGNSPLEVHLVMCGFPRSGTTLLQAIMAACVDEATTFDKERGALGVTRELLYSRRLLITKRPSDLLRINQIREFYRGRNARVRFIVSIRDPRDVLTSVWGNDSDASKYYVSPARWLAYYQEYGSIRDQPDVMILRYEELVSSPQSVLDEVANLADIRYSHPIDRYYERLPKTFVAGALNGLRPIDTRSIGRWQEPTHVRRIHEIVRCIPDFCQILRELGYEADERWFDSYRTPADASSHSMGGTRS